MVSLTLFGPVKLGCQHTEAVWIRGAMLELLKAKPFDRHACRHCTPLVPSGTSFHFQLTIRQSSIFLQADAGLPQLCLKPQVALSSCQI